MRSNDFRVDTTPSASPSILRRRQTLLGLALLLTIPQMISAVYLPIWGVASLSGMISVAFGKLPDLDWKHDTAADGKAIRAASIGGKIRESERERRRRLRSGRKAYSTR